MREYRTLIALALALVALGEILLAVNLVALIVALGW